jgi:uncharacterized protein involved in response to NO
MMTRGEQMLALRRSRMAASPSFLRGGFRPFFFGGAVWAIAAIVLWLCSLAGAITLPTAMDALAWHRHEMLFGFVAAIVAGFLLTAIPNWTGRLPIAGWPLASIALLWVAGRVAMLFSAHLGLTVTALIDSAFLFVMAAIGAQEVLAAKNRNLPVVAAVLLLGVANALDHVAISGLVDDPLLGIRVGIGVVTVLITLIGGRIVPSFTRNWLVKQGVKEGLPTQPGRVDMVAIGATIAAFFTWVFLPQSALAGALLILAGALQLFRLARWRGYRTFSDRLVLILHVGFAWVPIGLFLLGASILTSSVPQSAAIHALTAGAMASMILAVMTRATLGHTGRELRADAATQGTYALITLAALTRVSAPFLTDFYTGLMHATGVLWIAAFGLFLLVYGPILFRPRLGD